MAESFTSFSKIGVGFNVKTPVSEHLTGDTVTMVGVTQTGTNRFAMYVKAGGVIGANKYCTVDVTTDPYLATSVDGGAGTAMYQNGSIAFAASEYGWLMSTKTVISDATRAATADNALQLLGKTWNAPGTIGITTPSSGAFTTLGCTGVASFATGSAASFTATGHATDPVFASVNGTLTLNGGNGYVSINSAGTRVILVDNAFGTTIGVGTGSASFTIGSSKTNFTITPPTSSAGLVAGTLYQGAANAAFFA